MAELLRKIPFIRIVIPFTLGIVLQIFSDFSLWPFYGLSVALIIACFWIKYAKHSIAFRFKFRWMYGISFMVILFTLGARYIKPSEKERNNSKHFPEDNIQFTGIIIQQPSETEKSIKTVLKLSAVNDSSWHPASEKVLLYFEKNNSALQLKYGDRLIVSSRLSTIRNPGNPKEFNYKNFLAFKGIYHQGYARSGKWKLLERQQGNLFYQLAAEMRQRLMQIYHSNGIYGQEFSVLAALTLGNKDFLDEDTKRAYASSGAMHVLAVSGLHVGIFYIIFTYALFFLDKIKYGRWIKTGIIILFLWLFALLTGLSPSVMRAATMFTFIGIGREMKRPVNIYNVLAASAMVLMLINPYIVTEVGFQLSYAAVAGIVYFQPKFYRLIYIPWKIPDYFWQLLTVSIAAQLGTAPISLFYFHQFPAYFMLTNLIVIILVTFILYVAVFLLLFSFAPFIAGYIGKFLHHLIHWQNSSVKFIEELPYAVFQHISVTRIETFILYAVVFSLAIYMYSRKIKTLQYVFFFLLLFFVSQTWRNYQALQQQKMLVFNVRGSSALNLIHQKKSILVADSTLINEPGALEFSAQNFWTAVKVDKPLIYPIKNDSINNRLFRYENGFLQYQNQKIYILREKKISGLIPLHKYELDYLILSNNVNLAIEDILSYFQPEMIIIDSSNSYWKNKAWVKQCRELNLPFHSVQQHGAFIADLSR